MEAEDMGKDFGRANGGLPGSTGIDADFRVGGTDIFQKSAEIPKKSSSGGHAVPLGLLE